LGDIGKGFVGNSPDLRGPDQSNHCEAAKSGCGAAEQEKSILKTAGVKSNIARGGVEYRVRRGFSIPDRLCGIRFPYYSNILPSNRRASTRKSSQDHRMERPASGAALAGNEVTSVRPE